MKLRDTGDFDVIKIMGLTTTGRHGVYSFERENGQTFSVDIIMYVDSRGAAADDDLSQTVDYSKVAADVNEVLAGPPVFLIETLAHKVAKVVLSYEAVQIVEVVVHKPNAPMDLDFEDVSMTIRRARADESDNVVIAKSVSKPAAKPEPQRSSMPAAQPVPEPDAKPSTKPAQPQQPKAEPVPEPERPEAEPVSKASPVFTSEFAARLKEILEEPGKASPKAPATPSPAADSQPRDLLEDAPELALPKKPTRTRSQRHAAKRLAALAAAEAGDAGVPEAEQTPVAPAPADPVAPVASTPAAEPSVAPETASSPAPSKGEKAESPEPPSRALSDSSPLHKQLVETARQRAEREEWRTRHQREIEAAVLDAESLPIAKSMTDWRMGDPRPEPRKIKPPIISPDSPLHAALIRSYVTHSDLGKPPAEPTRAVIALGANMGEPWKTLAEAVVTMDAMPDTTVTGVSALFRTAPVLADGQAPQDDYYNAVVEVETQLSALSLLNALHMVENAFGRKRTEHWGPRTLDLDLITYGTLRSDEPELTLPHPRAHQRAFVLVPWLQIDPDARVGKFGRADELVKNVQDQDIEQVAETWIEDAIRGRGERFRRSNTVQQASAPAEPTAPIHTVAAGTPRRGTNRVVRTAKHHQRRRPRWAPIPGREPAAPEENSSGTPTAETPVTEAPATPSAAPTTPRGIFRRKTAVEPRIVDDAEELHRTLPEKPRMESGLSEDYATGLIPLTDEPKRPSRRTIMRPTVTGAIPIVNPNSEDDES
ncbi:MAG: 2-amino-4-hydroxy-6-hydroxymethyldihydropteridine diphosphokinase [Actinomycetaceae bacterium]|nr:2-amino-4-hydroxy-6-hydroxymethyldihydropteridine diphosphokinase [Actinomycetaceae bacterium]